MKRKKQSYLHYMEKVSLRESMLLNFYFTTKIFRDIGLQCIKNIKRDKKPLLLLDILFIMKNWKTCPDLFMTEVTCHLNKNGKPDVFGNLYFIL